MERNFRVDRKKTLEKASEKQLIVFVALFGRFSMALYRPFSNSAFTIISYRFAIGFTEKPVVQGRSRLGLGSGVTELFLTLASKSKD